MKKTEIKKQQESATKKQQNKATDNIKEKKNNELKRNIEITNNEISMKKTNDILKQINEYIDKEKKNLE